MKTILKLHCIVIDFFLKSFPHMKHNTEIEQQSYFLVSETAENVFNLYFISEDKPKLLQMIRAEKKFDTSVTKFSDYLF